MEKFTDGLSRRVVVAGMASTVAGILWQDGRAYSAPPAATGQATDNLITLRSRTLKVAVGTAFPRVAHYTHVPTGGVLQGQPQTITAILVDGKTVTPTKVDHTQVNDSRVDYRLHVDGGRLDASIVVEDDVVTFRVTRIEESDAFRVGTLEIPGLTMLRVNSDQEGATVRTAIVELDLAREGDTVLPVTAGTPVDDQRVGCAYAVLHTAKVGAGIESNSVVDEISKVKGSAWENARLWRQTTESDGVRSTGLSAGPWTYRAVGADQDDTEPLPYVRVILTGDRNEDGTIDWQDAAIALRRILPEPLGAKEQHLSVAPHIGYLNSSIAENNFLRMLESVKQVSLATDGLRQYTLVKGYAGEGHDCAHPDYGGHYNLRAGGLDHLNTLFRAGKRWNSDFAVHVNATEAYPEAHAFSEQLVDKSWEGWNGKDQSYRIRPRRDLTSGDIQRRFQQLRDETDDGLNTLYIDVFRESGWTSDRLQRDLRDQGWIITTEWGHGLERSAIWAHWAAEVDYGGDTARGVNSTLARFLLNHTKDVFADREPMLGIPQLFGFEAWQRKWDWNAYLRGIWEVNLPAKFLKAHPILRWEKDSITFEDGTVVSGTGKDRTITSARRTVLRGDTYLLPWEPKSPGNPPRLYHYNKTGGTTTWSLPNGWRRSSKIAMYRLTDQGRVFDRWVKVSDGTVELTAKAGQAYTLYRRAADDLPDPKWGEGTGLDNPFFSSGDLSGWTVTGAVSVKSSDRGHLEAHLGSDGKAATIRQQITGLEAGTSYAASFLVEIGKSAGQTRRTRITVTTPDGSVSEYLDRSTLFNSQEGDVKGNTRFHRVWTYFEAPAGGDVELAIDTAAGEAQVRIDHVRVAPGSRPKADGALVFEDFENVPFGYGAFVSCNIRTHFSEPHAPFTNKGWNGKKIDDVLSGSWSLKSRATSKDLQYRTIPSTVRFEPGRTYRVEFDYQSETEADWVTAVDAPTTQVLKRERLPKTSTTTRWKTTFTAPKSGDAWVGLQSQSSDSTEIVIDRFAVYEVS